MRRAEQRAILALEDGAVFEGRSFGAPGERWGEVVFNTSMTGYQEVLTDPSYKGQIVTMTYPLIGNYGVNDEDLESATPQVEGFVVKESCPFPSNWRSRETLGDFLKRHGIPGIEGVDTRALTRHIRTRGALRGVLSTEEADPGWLVEKARSAPPMAGSDWVQAVTCAAPYFWDSRMKGAGDPWGEGKAPGAGKNFLVAAVDFGVKWNMLRHLAGRGCRIRVFPARSSSAEILEAEPDGIFLSNGPGDPAALSYAVEAVRGLLGKRPLFGVCLGHQLLGLALGGKTYKLKFGHRGGNQPVKNLLNGKVEITAQNHGFCLEAASLPEEVEVTHINLNDRSLEGLRHRRLAAFSVQYHPEASPGPHDAAYLFDEFISLMESHSRTQSFESDAQAQ